MNETKDAFTSLNSFINDLSGMWELPSEPGYPVIPPMIELPLKFEKRGLLIGTSSPSRQFLNRDRINSFEVIHDYEIKDEGD